MIDPETAKQIKEILEGGDPIKEPTISDVTPPPDVAKRITEKLKELPLPALCVIHTFISMELKDRGIEFTDE